MDNKEVIARRTFTGILNRIVILNWALAENHFFILLTESTTSNAEWMSIRYYVIKTPPSHSRKMMALRRRQGWNKIHWICNILQSSIPILYWSGLKDCIVDWNVVQWLQSWLHCSWERKTHSASFCTLRFSPNSHCKFEGWLLGCRYRKRHFLCKDRWTHWK